MRHGEGVSVVLKCWLVCPRPSEGQLVVGLSGPMMQRGFNVASLEWTGQTLEAGGVRSTSLSRGALSHGFKIASETSWEHGTQSQRHNGRNDI